jgi:hypothetical protein
MQYGERVFKSVPTSLGPKTYEKLQKFSQYHEMSISRLVAIAVDNELQKEKPFEFDLNVPDEKYVDMAYADEAGKILQFLKAYGGMGVDMLMLVREDIGITDKRIFLLAFRELAQKGLIESYVPKTKGPKFDRAYWRAVDFSKQVKKPKRKATKYELYQKLKKEFGEE